MNSRPNCSRGFISPSRKRPPSAAPTNSPFPNILYPRRKPTGDVLFGRVLYVEKEGVLPEPYRALGDGRQAVLFRPAASPSSDMSSYISRWQRIYDRFDEKYGLNALVSVD